MKLLTLCLAFIVGSAVSGTDAFATTFRGKIIETLYSYEDADVWPHYHAGERFIGYYEYRSATKDGNFRTHALCEEPLPGWVDTLDGVVLVPFLSGARGTLEGEPVEYNDGFGPMITRLADTRNYGTLKVQDGHVSHFWWSWETGGFYTEMDATQLWALNFYDSLDQPHETGAAVVFTDPVALPDGGSTLALFGFALVGAVALRRSAARLARQAGRSS